MPPANSNPNTLPSLAPRPTSSTVDLLRRISCSAFDMLNAHDFTHTTPVGRELLSRFASDLEGQLDNYPDKLNLIQLNQICAMWPILQPNIHFELKDTEVIVDEARGEGTVFMTVDVTGLTEEVVLEGFVELKWRRESSGMWLIKSFHGMRGLMGGPV